MAATISSRSEQAQPSGTVSLKPEGQRRVRTFLVKVSEPSNSVVELIANDSGGLPTVGSSYGSTGLVCTDININRAQPNNNTLYKIDYIYTCPYRAGQPLATAPWDRPTRYVYSTKLVPFSMQKDFTTPTALPVLNTAGDHYGEPVMAGNLNMIISAHYSSKTKSSSLFYNVGCTNSASVTIDGQAYATIGQVLFAGGNSVQSSWVAADGTETVYYDISLEYEITWAPWGHDVQVLSRGYHYKNGSGALTRCTVKDPLGGADLLASTPQLLDAIGAVTTTPYYQTFRTHPRVALPVPP